MSEPNKNPEPIQQPQEVPQEVTPEAAALEIPKAPEAPAQESAPEAPETAAQEVPVPEEAAPQEAEPAAEAPAETAPAPTPEASSQEAPAEPAADAAAAQEAPAEPAPAAPVPADPISDLPQMPRPTPSQLWWGKTSFQMRRWLRKSLGLLVIACLIACAAYGAYLYRSSHEFKSLSTQKDQIAETVSTEPTVEATEPTAPVETGPTEPSVLPQMQELAERNPDFFGWLTIEGTRIDYPVMHNMEEPEKYLYANFDGEYRFSGTPFLDGNCYPDSDNFLIHAHNMLDGSMFRGLLEYEKESYWKEHPTIHFTTLYDEGEYEILAAFRDRVYFEDEDCFKFYKFIDAADEADFDNAIANFKEKALYDTGITASYGDQLITLATCAYHVEDGRFVVVARKAN